MEHVTNMTNLVVMQSFTIVLSSSGGFCPSCFGRKMSARDKHARLHLCRFAQLPQGPGHHPSARIDVDVRELDVAAGELRTDSFLALKVPAFEDGNLRLWESNAIMLDGVAPLPEGAARV